MTDGILSDEQYEVIHAIRSGYDVFYTGPAGTGKSFILHRIREEFDENEIAFTAPTGTAAVNIHGKTIHSFGGFGRVDETRSAEDYVEHMSAQVKQRWRSIRALFIDEVSMISGGFFTLICEVAKLVRGDSRLQMICCGDFFQLGPVRTSTGYAFESPWWNQIFKGPHGRSFQLTRPFRQDDADFFKVLNEVRVGRVSAETVARLTSPERNTEATSGGQATTALDFDPLDGYVYIFPQNVDVNRINGQIFRRISRGKTTHYFPANDDSEEAESFFKKLGTVPEELELCEGTDVMLTCNLNFDRGLYNGLRGTVIGFHETDGLQNLGIYHLPIVRFQTIRGVVEEVIRPYKFQEYTRGTGVMTRIQLPLRLAYAITVHRSQGMTIEKLVIDFTRGAFAPGQFYTAISRAKSESGIQFRGFDVRQITTDPAVIAFYQTLE